MSGFTVVLVKLTGRSGHELEVSRLEWIGRSGQALVRFFQSIQVKPGFPRLEEMPRWAEANKANSFSKRYPFIGND
jgi:hypothetical protein